MLYGIPYMGSKTKIAEDIIRILPSGKRFVDLFGGGFAMSHCALESWKYEKVFYNEINPLLPPLIKKAINGDFNYERFKPEFVTRERFNAEKDKDGYIACIWSFGNNPGKQYMFGRDVEPLKHEAHDFVVFGKVSERLKGAEKFVTAENIHDRRMQFRTWLRSEKKRFDLQQLQQLERLERLQQLERLERLQQLERLERLEIHLGSYEDYEYKEGDVVYCDPPYENTAKYKSGFDHAAFYNWLRTRDYKVWFSSYEGLDFPVVWRKQVRTSLGSNKNAARVECLYTNENKRTNSILRNQSLG